MFDKVKDILKVIMPDPTMELEPNMTLIGDIGLKSMDIINLIGMFENTYDIEISDDDLRRFIRVSDIVLYLEENINLA